MQIIVYILFFACELQIDKETQILMGIQVCLRTSTKKISGDSHLSFVKFEAQL